MSYRRRFLNLVTANDVVGMYSLRRIDLHAHDNSLFYPTAAAALDAAAEPEPDSSQKKKMERIPVPNKLPMLFSGRWLEWFPLSERKVVYMDHDSRDVAIYHADERCVDALPDIQGKGSSSSGKFPICFSVDSGEADDVVYFMDRYRKKRARDGDEVNRFPFQALVRREDRWSPSSNVDSSSSDRWRRDELFPPPYINGDAGNVLCVSTEGIGTFCFDTASRRWTKAGDWALPFSGKVEHVPELGGVLVGFWASECAGHRLCAAPSGVDLPSPVDSSGRPGVRPTLRSWLVLEPPPCGEEWVKVKAPQLVSLGSGKFCLAEFFKAASGVVEGSGEEVDEWFVVLTGVEVVRDGRIRMVKHKSKRYVSTSHKFGRPATVEFVL